ncbi:MAG: hypothetical protein KDD55_12660 [Bdellovibrionales bacterium]|nr:hypothetical protein [Bdellovibrionales bacterium]
MSDLTACNREPEHPEPIHTPDMTVGDTIVALGELRTPAGAREFLLSYEQDVRALGGDPTTARENVDFLTGYYFMPGDCMRIRDLFIAGLREV